MISIDNISYYLGDRTLYEDASLFITSKDKIGLIGLNGTGKSTLLKMLVGEVELASGNISKSKSTSIGFLNQDLLSYESDEPILEVAMQAFHQALDLQHQIDIVLKEMEVNYTDKLLERLSLLQEQFEAADGYTIQSQAEELLEGIGFKTTDLKRPLREFSGGWRMRVMLAKLLLEKPSLLMLDEPTNHLDLPSIQWIETYLQNYEGAYIIVSHDRTFLNSTVNKIVEVYSNKLNLYPGNYDYYLQEKELRNEVQQNAFENQQQKIKEAERFIERFKAKATKAKQAQSKLKQLEKLDRIKAVVDENMHVNFKFNFKTQSGRHVKRLENISKSYGDLDILINTTLGLQRGDKVALIGANGKGKSTVLRIIAGTEVHEGQVETGHNVSTSFYAQHQLEALNINNDLVEELKQEGTGKNEQELRGILGCFLFSGDEVFKKIKVLSGGEKSRVALAKALISEANFLLLDEPTNHLDILSVGILVQALQQYEGTFLVVSHDRHFITKVANKIWWIEDHQLKEYPGNYEDYQWWMSQRASPTKSKVTKEKKTKTKEKPIKDKSQATLNREIANIEDQIQEREALIKSLETEMTQPDIYQDSDRLSELNDQFQKVKNEANLLTKEWEILISNIK
ncbi:MAG: ABC transporter ATP-binding protein [Flammeovirgaceae bacterium]|nr:ABC transporter ATP-binding protein [Flammeovirgaceae bacterium]